MPCVQLAAWGPERQFAFPARPVLGPGHHAGNTYMSRAASRVEGRLDVLLGKGAAVGAAGWFHCAAPCRIRPPFRFVAAEGYRAYTVLTRHRTRCDARSRTRTWKRTRGSMGVMVTRCWKTGVRNLLCMVVRSSFHAQTAFRNGAERGLLPGDKSPLRYGVPMRLRMPAIHESWTSSPRPTPDSAEGAPRRHRQPQGPVV